MVEYNEACTSFSCQLASGTVVTILLFSARFVGKLYRWRNISGRNPKIDGSASRVHLFNNFWKNVTYFSIGVGDYAQTKVEGNYFENAAKPHWDTGNGLIDADIPSNRYTGISASDPDKDSGSTVFSDINLYSYSLESANDVPGIVDQGAGPK